MLGTTCTAEFTALLVAPCCESKKKTGGGWCLKSPVGGPDDDDVRRPVLPVEAVHESQQLRQGSRPFPAARLVAVPVPPAPPTTKQTEQRCVGQWLQRNGGLGAE